MELEHYKDKNEQERGAERGGAGKEDKAVRGEDNLEATAETAAIEQGGEGSEDTAWEVWKDSEWYGELVRFMLQGDFGGREIGKEERRRIRLWARRFVLFDGERKKGLFYKEKDGRLALCIMPEDVIPLLERYHDCHGHFAGRMLTGYLLGKVYWPTRVKDAHYYARTCTDCQSMGPIRPSAGVKPVVHL